MHWLSALTKNEIIQVEEIYRDTRVDPDAYTRTEIMHTFLNNETAILGMLMKGVLPTEIVTKIVTANPKYIRWLPEDDFSEEISILGLEHGMRLGELPIAAKTARVCHRAVELHPWDLANVPKPMRSVDLLQLAITTDSTTRTLLPNDWGVVMTHQGPMVVQYQPVD